MFVLQLKKWVIYKHKAIDILHSALKHTIEIILTLFLALVVLYSIRGYYLERESKFVHLG